MNSTELKLIMATRIWLRTNENKEDYDNLNMRITNEY